MKTLISLLFLVSTVAFAQTNPAPKPPVLTADQKLEFFKAQAEYQSAQAKVTEDAATAQQKQTALQASIKTLTDACGKDFTPSIDPKGYPVCVAKPESEVKK